MELPRPGEVEPSFAAEGVPGFWTAEEAALDDLWEQAHGPSDADVDEGGEPAWTLNLGGEGEELPGMEGRVVNVNSLTLEGSFRDPDRVARYAERNGQLVVIADARRLPFRDDSVDLVVSRDLVEEDRKSVAAEAGRVLRPGGRKELEFCEHGIESKWHNDTERRRAWLDGTPDPGPAWSRTPQEVTLGSKPPPAVSDGSDDTPASEA